MNVGIEELVDVAGKAEWRRRKAEEHPLDTRNVEAAELLERLAPEVASLEGGELHRQLNGLWQSDGATASERTSETLRSVGFNSFPSSGQELVQEIIDAMS